MFCPNNYAYSCLTKMKDGNMGLLYEHQNTIKFTAFNLEYIKDEVNFIEFRRLQLLHTKWKKQTITLIRSREINM